MNETDFGTTLLKMLGFALPVALFLILLVSAAMCAFGASAAASKIEGDESTGAFANAWILWGIGLAALALAAWTSHTSAVTAILSYFSPSTQRTAGVVVAAAYLLPVVRIVWRSVVEIVKRLSN